MDKKDFERLDKEGAFVISNQSNLQWENPIPFSTVKTPDFPVDCLPETVGRFVEQLAESTQTPKEMAGILSLGILATAFQSRYDVEITPDWKEPLCLYPVAIAEPGERKSAVISALSHPVYEYEAEQRELEAAEIAQNQTERTILEKALQAAQNSVTKGKGNYEAKRQEALDLSAQLANFKEKHPLRLLADDTTPEKLVEIMETQGGSITVASAEGGIFDAIKGRYDRAANFDIYLKGHSGDPLSVERIGRKSNYIAAPRLTMMLTIQPAVLHGLMDNETLRGRGLCGRFLYVMCKSKMGQRDVSPVPISATVKEEYCQFVRKILSAQGSGTIYLSTEANSVREKYQARIERRLGKEWLHMRDWGSKLVGAAVRIAALLHLSSFPATEPIGKNIMLKAACITEFLGTHAEAAYQAMGVDKNTENAEYILKRLVSEGKEKISRADLTSLCHGKFKKAADMNPALEILVERFYIREAENAIGYNNRKQIEYLVNPSVWN